MKTLAVILPVLLLASCAKHTSIASGNQLSNLNNYMFKNYMTDEVNPPPDCGCFTPPDNNRLTK